MERFGSAAAQQSGDEVEDMDLQQQPEPGDLLCSPGGGSASRMRRQSSQARHLDGCKGTAGGQRQSQQAADQAELAVRRDASGKLFATTTLAGGSTVISQEVFMHTILRPGAAHRPVSDLFTFYRPRKRPRSTSSAILAKLSEHQHDVMYALAGCSDVTSTMSKVDKNVRQALFTVFGIDKVNFNTWFKNRRQVLPKRADKDHPTEAWALEHGLAQASRQRQEGEGDGDGEGEAQQQEQAGCSHPYLAGGGGVAAAAGTVGKRLSNGWQSRSTKAPAQQQPQLQHGRQQHKGKRSGRDESEEDGGDQEDSEDLKRWERQKRKQQKQQQKQQKLAKQQQQQELQDGERAAEQQQQWEHHHHHHPRRPVKREQEEEQQQEEGAGALALAQLGAGAGAVGGEEYAEPLPRLRAGPGRHRRDQQHQYHTAEGFETALALPEWSTAPGEAEAMGQGYWGPAAAATALQDRQRRREPSPPPATAPGTLRSVPSLLSTQAAATAAAAAAAHAPQASPDDRHLPPYHPRQPYPLSQHATPAGGSAPASGVPSVRFAPSAVAAMAAMAAASAAAATGLLPYEPAPAQQEESPPQQPWQWQQQQGEAPLLYTPARPMRAPYGAAAPQLATASSLRPHLHRTSPSPTEANGGAERQPSPPPPPRQQQQQQHAPQRPRHCLDLDGSTPAAQRHKQHAPGRAAAGAATASLTQRQQQLEQHEQQQHRRRRSDGGCVGGDAAANDSEPPQQQQQQLHHRRSVGGGGEIASPLVPPLYHDDGADARGGGGCARDTSPSPGPLDQEQLAEFLAAKGAAAAAAFVGRGADGPPPRDPSVSRAGSSAAAAAAAAAAAVPEPALLEEEAVPAPLPLPAAATPPAGPSFQGYYGAVRYAPRGALARRPPSPTLQPGMAMGYPLLGYPAPDAFRYAAAARGAAAARAVAAAGVAPPHPGLLVTGYRHLPLQPYFHPYAHARQYATTPPPRPPPQQQPSPPWEAPPSSSPREAPRSRRRRAGRAQAPAAAAAAAAPAARRCHRPRRRPSPPTHGRTSSPTTHTAPPGRTTSGGAPRTGRPTLGGAPAALAALAVTTARRACLPALPAPALTSTPSTFLMTCAQSRRKIPLGACTDARQWRRQQRWRRRQPGGSNLALRGQRRRWLAMHPGRRG